MNSLEIIFVFIHDFLEIIIKGFLIILFSVIAGIAVGNLIGYFFGPRNE